METDRPDETESASVVPVKTLQFETGLYFEKDQQNQDKLRMMQYPVVLMRLGILKWLEFRVQGAYQKYAVESEAVSTKTVGFAPLTLGAKTAVCQEQGIRPQAAVMLMIDMPIGSKAFKPSEPEAELRLMFKNTLTEKFDLNYNLVHRWEDGSTTKGYAVSVGAAISNRITLYAEVFGNKYRHEKATHSLDAGVLFLILPTLQIDFAAGKALNAVAPDYFISTGLSVRLPN